MIPRTPEHQARIDRMRERLAKMPDHKVVSVLEAIMGLGDDEINEMTPEEIDAELRAEGIDPDVSLVVCMGGVLADLSRKLHDYRATLVTIYKIAERVKDRNAATMGGALDRIAELARVPPRQRLCDCCDDTVGPVEGCPECNGTGYVDEEED